MLPSEATDTLRLLPFAFRDGIRYRHLLRGREVETLHVLVLLGDAYHFLMDEPLPPMPSDIHPLPGFHDPFSSMSHLFGAVLFAVLGYLILRRGRGNTLRMTFLGVYAFACVFLFSMSGVYHMMVRGGTAREVLGRLDHNAIFVLIAGSFTPAHGILFRGWLRWGPLIFIWMAAITGIVLKTIFFHDLAEWVGLLLYLVLGWLGAFSGLLLYKRFGYRFIQPLLWGGVAYSIGGAVEGFNWPILIPRVIGSHEVFHIAVLVGAVLHWVFTWRFAAWEPPQKEPSTS